LSDEAKLEWGRISQELYQMGVLTNVDRAALCGYCDAWSDYVDASRACNGPDGQDRKVIRNEAGEVIENPFYRIKKCSMELMHKFLREFGLTPASRTRISAEPPGGKQKPNSRWTNHGFDR
jgi:P27 family predicted phage terminase small subunit